MVKNPPVHLQSRRLGFDPWVGNICWRVWQPTPVFLPGESPWTEEPCGLQSMGRKELAMSEQLTTQTIKMCNFNIRKANKISHAYHTLIGVVNK